MPFKSVGHLFSGHRGGRERFSKFSSRVDIDSVSLRSVGLSDDEDQQEKTLSQVYDRLPEGRSPLEILKKKDERERIGKSEHR